VSTVDPPVGDPLGATADAPVDGRSARAERTRTAIVDAVLELLSEGDFQPTANRIAERAGISLRLIYHHFGDLESLYRAVGQRSLVRLTERTRRIPVDQPLDARIDQLVAQRCDILEWLTPIMRAAQINIGASAGALTRRSLLHTRGEREVDVVFAAELDPLEAARRTVVGSALNGTLFWGHWDDLRTSGRSIDEAREAVLLTVRAIFASIAHD
jgi:TetR/AcrR family transcriptional regulator, regulator of autoinduction and epiphytic fitness